MRQHFGAIMALIVFGLRDNSCIPLEEKPTATHIEAFWRKISRLWRSTVFISIQLFQLHRWHCQLQIQLLLIITKRYKLIPVNFDVVF